VTRVALIFGGVSPEHEVSIHSAGKVAEALREIAPARGLSLVPIYINREGEWVFWTGDWPSEATIGEAPKWDARPEDFPVQALPFHRALGQMVEQRIGVAMIMIHGIGGEDGRIQAALDLAEIPYTGTGAAASALALDKPRCQAVLNAAGLPIANSACLTSDGIDGAERLVEVVGLPCVIKPARGGSSVGVTIVRELEQLRPALEAAFAIDEELMAERLVTGREFTVGLIERDGGLLVTPVTEIIPPEGRYFDYDAKYTVGVSREITPAEIPAQLAERLRSLAAAAFRAVGCRGFARVDMIADPAAPTILEINTIPGMTATSLLPQGAAAMGISFSELLGFFLDSARFDRG